MDYAHFKAYKDKAMNNACWNRFIFWAFNEKQLEEGLKKVEAKKNKHGKWMLCKVAGGGYMSPKGIDSFHAFWDNWERYEKKFRENEDYIINGLVDEYANHEAQFGMGGKASAEEYFPQATDTQKAKAWKKFMALCRKNNWL